MNPLTRLVSFETARFLVVGLVNTVIGYLIGVGIYLFLAPIAHIVFIGILGGVISIVVSFLTQRVWVFRSSGPWWPQLRRSFVVYGSLSLVGIPVLWWLLDGVGLSIWIAQAVVLVIGAGLSYAGQKWFTFRVSVPPARN
jgi:putative flippase GtrA